MIIIPTLAFPAMTWKKIERLVVDGRREAKTPKIMKDRRQFLSATSLTCEEFQELFEKLKVHMCRAGYRQYSRSAKKNKCGAGRTHECPLIDRAAMALMQLRGTSGEITGLAFDVSYDVARAALDEIVPAIKSCVEIPRRVVARLLRQGANASLLEFVPDPESSLDAMVVNTTRPPWGKAGRAFYRRKKGNGLNVQTIVDWGGRFIDVSTSVPASVHDMKVFWQKADRALLRRFETIFADPGYTGAEKVPHTNIKVAAKRPPGGKLTDEEIAINRWISSKRFVVERGNAFIKNYGIVNKMHWYDSAKLDDVIQVVCGLINFRTVRRKKHPVNWGHANRPRRPPVSDPRNVRPEMHTSACQAVFDARDGQRQLTLLCY